MLVEIILLCYFSFLGNEVKVPIYFVYTFNLRPLSKKGVQPHRVERLGAERKAGPVKWEGAGPARKQPIALACGSSLVDCCRSGRPMFRRALITADMGRTILMREDDRARRGPLCKGILNTFRRILG